MGAIWNGIKAGLGHTLAFFYSIIPDYGIAIILLTVAVSLLLFPLTLKQTRSMRAMQEIQPEVKKLQKELKGDREELNKQLMELYKEKGVNPAAGCLPLLAQMPIWFALFQVLRLSVASVAVLGTVAVGSPGAAEGLMPGDEVIAVDDSSVDSWEDVTSDFEDGAPHQVTIRRDGGTETVTLEDLSGLAPTGERQLDPDNIIPQGSALAAGLKEGDTDFLAMDLLISPADAADDGISNAIPYIVLILLVMVTGYYQQWQTTRRRNPDQQDSPQQQSMQTVMKIMPLFLGFISWSFPTGLVLYFAASAIFRIGQQSVILRLDEEDDEEDEDSESEHKAKSGDGTGGRSSQGGNGQPRKRRKGISPHTSKKKKRRRK